MPQRPIRHTNHITNTRSCVGRSGIVYPPGLLGFGVREIRSRACPAYHNRQHTTAAHVTQQQQQVRGGGEGANWSGGRRRQCGGGCCRSGCRSPLEAAHQATVTAEPSTAEHVRPTNRVRRSRRLLMGCSSGWTALDDRGRHSRRQQRETRPPAHVSRVSSQGRHTASAHTQSELQRLGVEPNAAATSPCQSWSSLAVHCMQRSALHAPGRV